MTVKLPSVRVREISRPDAMARLSCSKSLGDKRFTRQIPPHRHTSRRFPGTGFPSCRQLRSGISAHLSALPQWIWTDTPPAPRKAPWRPPPGPWFSLTSHYASIPVRLHQLLQTVQVVAVAQNVLDVSKATTHLGGLHSSRMEQSYHAL